MDNSLSIQLYDLPRATVGAILGLLQDAYAAHNAAAAVVIFDLQGGKAVGEITVKDTEAALTATVTALDAEGHETTFDGVPTWASSDEAVASVRPSDDGYSAEFDIGDPGSAVITVTGIENSTGEDVEIVSTGLINVTAGDAVVGSVDFSVPQ